MKKGISIFVGIAFIMAMILNSKADGGKPVIKFDSMVHNFGIFKEGEIVNCRFEITNMGNAPLVINDVERPCGCTLPVWTKRPIQPGDTGSVRIFFNSKDRPGVFRKTFLVSTNIDTSQIILMIKGNADKHYKKKVSPAE